jgi:putative membrane protein
MGPGREVLYIRVPEWLVILVKGMLMGIADIIPGVSGGTLALITGIYERFIHALRTINLRWLLKYLRRDPEGAKKDWRSIDLPFLVPLVVGIIVAVVLFAQVLTYVLEHQAGPTFAFFFGLILASAGAVLKYIDRVSAGAIVAGVLGFLFVIYIVGLDEIVTNHSLWILLASGAIAIGAMLLPGISGSLVLLILGQYEYMLEVLSRGSVKEMVVFGVGAVTGVLLFSRALDYLLKHHRSVTMAFLLGCMLGALRLPAEILVDVTDTSSAPGVALVIASAVVGFLAVFVLETRSKRIAETLGIEVE